MRLIAKSPGVYETEDGVYSILLDDTWETECLAEHPMKITQEDRAAWAAMSGWDKNQLFRTNWEKWDALMNHKKGYVCPGNETHYYKQWTAGFKDGSDYFGGDIEAYDRFGDAVAALERHLGEKVIVVRPRKPKAEKPVQPVEAEMTIADIEEDERWHEHTAERMENDSVRAIHADELRAIEENIERMTATLATEDGPFVDLDLLKQNQRRRFELRQLLLAE